MSTSPTPDQKWPEDITPEVLAEALVISYEKVRETGKLPPSPKLLSQQIRSCGKRLVRGRTIAVGLALFFSVVSICNCYCVVPSGAIWSVIGIIISLAIPVLLLQEFLIGAGSIIQSQFERGDALSREFSFEPSVKTFGGLALLIVVATLGIIVGFASLYCSIARYDAGAITGSSEGFTAMYFSVVTFATVGFGDIYPTTLLSRTVIVTEILIAWALLALAFSTLISWVTWHIQRLHESRLAHEESEMQKREEAIKAAGVGLYGGVENFDQVLAEAKRRVAYRRKTG
jgi:hypothetical protein